MRDRRAGRAGAALAAALALAVPAAPAFAQAPGSVPPPPVRQAVDENGVDVVRGEFTAAQTAVSIGPAWPHGLFYASVNMNAGWFSNIRSEIVQSGSTWIATVDGASDGFTRSGGLYTPTEANGASLVQAGGFLTYTARSGTVAAFTLNSGGLPFWDSGYARATAITYADGTKVRYHHKIVIYCPGGVESGQCPSGYHYAMRLQSITNNHGYQLKLSYAANVLDDLVQATTYDEWSRVVSVKAINNAVDYCDPAADSCTLTGAWPTASFATAAAGGGGSELVVTDPSGEATRYTSDVSHRLVAVRRPGAAADNVTLSYGPGGVASLTRDGVTHNYAYATDSTTRTTTVTAPDGGVRVYTTGLASSRLVSFRDELLRTTTYEHDPNGRLTAVQAPEGNRTQLSYDVRGNVTETRLVAKSGPGPGDIVAAAAFPAACANPKTCNKPVSTTDPRMNVTEYGYDAAHGGVLSVTLPAPAPGAVRPETRFGYTALQAYYRNAAGAIVASGENVHLPTSTSACQTLASCAGGADEVKTTTSWGPQSAGTANNLLPVATSSGSGDGALTATVTAAYDAIGNLVSVDGPLAGAADTATFRYDANRRRVGTITPDPDGGGALLRRAQRIAYGSSGNTTGLVTKVEQGTVSGTSDSDWAAFAALQGVELTYDSNARPVRRALTGGGAVQAVTDLAYDSLGRPSCSAVRMNPAAWGTLTNGCALQTAGTQGPDRISRTLYDVRGQATQVQSAWLTADQADEVTNSYTFNGRLETATDAEGNKTTYEYDGFDRLAKMSYPHPTVKGTSSATDYEQLTYDAASNVTGLRLRDGTSIAFGYDALNRVTSKNLPTGNDTAYTYDNLGRLTSQGWAGHMLTFTYDALGRNLTQVSPQGTLAYQYDLAGRRTRMTYPGSGLFVDYDYLLTGEVTKIRENGAGSGVGVLATYAYDNLGRRTSLTRGNGTTATYGFDNASRLSQLVENMTGATHDLTLDFTYNPASQIATNTRSNDLYSYTAHANVSRSYSLNGLNQVTQMIDAVTTNVTHDARGNTTAIGTASYGYSAENMLTSAPGGATLAYDPALRLHQVAGASTTRFLYDGPDVIAEYNDSNVLQRRFVHGPGADEPLVWYEGTGTSDRRFLHADERGSIVAISNGSGTVTNVNRYDEYGVPAAGNVGRFQYTGQKWIAEAGLYDYKARMYHPALGRFMQTDPIGYGSGMNLYAYVRGDPVNFSDPSGMLCWFHTVYDWVWWVEGKTGWPTNIRHYFSCDENLGGSSTRSGDVAGGGSGGGDNGTPQPRPASLLPFPPTRRLCSGAARILAGNPNLVGRIGGFPGVKVEAGSAAIIPRQFTGQLAAGPHMRSIGQSAFGMTGGGQFFSGFTDTVDDDGLARTAREAQDLIMGRNPDLLILELVTGKDEGVNSIQMLLPAFDDQGNATACPTGTIQLGAF